MDQPLEGLLSEVEVQLDGAVDDFCGGQMHRKETTSRRQHAQTRFLLCLSRQLVEDELRCTAGGGTI